MVDRCLNWGSRQKNDRGWRLGGMSHLVFKGVKDYICMYTKKSDPLPNWANHFWFSSLSRNRTDNHDPKMAVEFMQTYWPNLGKALSTVPKQACEENRFGEIPSWVKFEPSIKRWKIPRISSIGLNNQVINAFNDSKVSSYAQIMMDQAINDLFD